MGPPVYTNCDVSLRRYVITLDSMPTASTTGTHTLLYKSPVGSCNVAETTKGTFESYECSNRGACDGKSDCAPATRDTLENRVRPKPSWSKGRHHYCLDCEIHNVVLAAYVATPKNIITCRIGKLVKLVDCLLYTHVSIIKRHLFSSQCCTRISIIKKHLFSSD